MCAMAALGARARPAARRAPPTSRARCRSRRCRARSRASIAAIHAARPHAGQVASAANVRRLLEGSAILESHRWCDKVQDAYSLRCAAQVHGASRDLLDYVERTVEIELNAATDNPLVLLDEREIVSNGNFHGQPVAFALDSLVLAVAELANISERRVERMVNPSLSDGLPAFLTREGGINSGMMILQYVAASLVSENKALAHPASVDSIPTSAGQEDHVSMGNAAGLKALQVLANAERSLAIELLAGAQAVEFLAPLEPGRGRGGGRVRTCGRCPSGCVRTGRSRPTSSASQPRSATAASSPRSRRVRSVAPVSPLRRRGTAGWATRGRSRAPVPRRGPRLRRHGRRARRSWRRRRAATRFARVLAALIFFALATGWSWWRFRVPDQGAGRSAKAAARSGEATGGRTATGEEGR